MKTLKYLIIILCIIALLSILIFWIGSMRYNNTVFSRLDVNEINPPEKCKGYFVERIINLADNLDELNKDCNKPNYILINSDEHLEIKFNEIQIVKPILGTQSVISKEGFRIYICVFDSKGKILDHAARYNENLIKWDQNVDKIIDDKKYYVLRQCLIINKCDCGVEIDADVHPEADHELIKKIFKLIHKHLIEVELKDIPNEVGIYKETNIKEITEIKVGLEKDRLFYLIGYPDSIERFEKSTAKMYRLYRYVSSNPFKVVVFKIDTNDIVTDIKYYYNHKH